MVAAPQDLAKRRGPWGRADTSRSSWRSWCVMVLAAACRAAVRRRHIHAGLPGRPFRHAGVEFRHGHLAGRNAGHGQAHQRGGAGAARTCRASSSKWAGRNWARTPGDRIAANFTSSSRRMRPSTRASLQEQLRAILEDYPGIQSEVVTFLGDRISESLSGETAQVAVKVFGDDLDTLEATADKIVAVARQSSRRRRFAVQAPERYSHDRHRTRAGRARRRRSQGAGCARCRRIGVCGQGDRPDLSRYSHRRCGGVVARWGAPSARRGCPS